MEKKFLEFNGAELHFTLKNGVWLIALKPICEALNVDWIAQFKRVKSDKILAPALSVETMQVGESTAEMPCFFYLEKSVG